VVEVLKDGGPVHPYDEHFRFGCEKAKLIVAAMDVIAEFASNTRDDGSTTVDSQVILSQRFRIQFHVWVEMHEEFTHSLGFTVYKPWLRLEVLPSGTGAHIGVGVQKAKALVALREDLERWVAGACR
jgi:hypothetical protein